MSDQPSTSPQTGSSIPPDDPQRKLTVARPNEDKSLPHVGIVGATYTILVTGHDTAGRYCLIDMHVPPGGGPPPHRHDFEEMFSVLEGEIEVTFRDKTQVIGAGATVNIPANAPHRFTNASGKPVRLLCMCTPAGLDEFFMAIGDPVEDRLTPPPKLDKAGMAERMKKAETLAPKYRTELLKPWGGQRRGGRSPRLHPDQVRADRTTWCSS